METTGRREAKFAQRGEAAGGSSRILIVGGEPAFRAALVGELKAKHHHCTHVGRLDEALAAHANGRFDLIVVNPTLPDGDGLELARRLQRSNATTKTVIFSDTGSFSVALDALRCGVADFVHTPVELTDFIERIEAALSKSRWERNREQRIRRLQRICQELSSAREEISGQVDVLCNDLVLAYQELTDQIGDVAMASEFRTLLRQELDIEDLLRTMLEYLLSRTGPTNAAVFLPDPDQHYSLGAYVNYDCPRESIDRLLDHLGEAICPQMSDETELVMFDDAEEFARWIDMDEGLLSDSQVLAFSCTHEGECLAVIVLFRSNATPFDAKLAGTLDILRAIFAEQLSQIIRVHHRATPQWPAEPDEDDLDEFGFGFAA
jgi:DNA-binding response OmpR family regulator